MEVDLGMVTLRLLFSWISGVSRASSNDSYSDGDKLVSRQARGLEKSKSSLLTPSYSGLCLGIHVDMSAIAVSMTSQQSEDQTLHRIARKQRLKRAKGQELQGSGIRAKKGKKDGMRKELKGFDEFQVEWPGTLAADWRPRAEPTGRRRWECICIFYDVYVVYV